MHFFRTFCFGDEAEDDGGEGDGRSKVAFNEEDETGESEDKVEESAPEPSCKEGEKMRVLSTKKLWLALQRKRWNWLARKRLEGDFGKAQPFMSGDCLCWLEFANGRVVWKGGRKMGCIGRPMMAATSGRTGCAGERVTAI